MATLLGLAALEGVARSAEAPGAAVRVDVASPLPFQQLPDADVLMEVSEGWTFHPLSINHHSQYVPRAKPADELRVLIIGGSTAAGDGLPRLAGPVAVAERALRDVAPGRRVRLINLGRSGYGSPQVASLVEATLERLDPDLIVTMMGNNERHDIANVVAREGEVGRVLRARELRRRFALARLLRPPLPSPVDPTAAAPDPARLWEIPDRSRVELYSESRFARGITRIAQAAEAHGVPVLVATMPVNWRYEDYGHEWFFFGDHVTESRIARAGHLAATYRGFDDRVVQAGAETWRTPTVGDQLVLAQARRRLGEPDAELEVGLATWAAGVGDADVESEPAVLAAWLRAFVDPGGDPRERADELVGSLATPLRRGGESCLVADIRWYSGDTDRARQAYSECFTSQHYYRADEAINVALRREAARHGFGIIELESSVRQASPSGVPDYTLFHDYCHYNARGAVLVGHLLAAEVAKALRLAPPEAPQTAVAAHNAAWEGRMRDFGAIEDWVGIDFDIDRLSGQPGKSPEPPWDRPALTLVYEGNQWAQSASVANPEARDEAERAWLGALELEPTLATARQNLEWLRAEAGSP